MARVATGTIMLTLNGLREFVAGSAAFQAWCREAIDGFPAADDPEASAEAALARVYLYAKKLAGQASDDMFCLISPFPKQQLEGDATGADGYIQSGGMIVEFFRQVPREYRNDIEAALMDFAGWEDGDDAGGVDVIMEQVYAQSSDGGVFIRNYELVEGPALLDEGEEIRANKTFAAMYVVNWGFE